MAAPTVHSSTAPASGGASTSNANTAIGDLVVVATWERAGAGIPTHTIQSGFTEIHSQPHEDGTTDGRLSIAYKVATAAGAQSYQAYTTSTGSPVWWTGLVVLDTNTFDTSGILATGATGTGNQAPNPPSRTGLTSTRDYLGFATAAWHFGSAVTNTVTFPTTPGTWTGRGDVSGSANGDLATGTAPVAAGSTSFDPGAYADNQTPNGTSSVTYVVPNKVSITATVNQIIETDTAQAVTWAPKNRLVNLITEADLSQAVTILRTYGIGQITETDLAQALTVARRYTLLQAAETDLAQVITVVTSGGPILVTVNQSTETDLAQTVIRNPQARLINLATETDIAQALTIARRYTIGQALETDIAQTVLWSPQRRLVGQAIETDQAFVVTYIGGASGGDSDGYYYIRISRVRRR